MRFECMEKNKALFPVDLMSRVFEVSRSGYYQWRKAGSARSVRATKELALIRNIEDIHSSSRGIYGSPKIASIMSGLRDGCSKNTVARLMQKYGIRSRIRRKFKKTTNSAHRLGFAPNLLVQDFKANVPNQLWAGDITYIRTREGWLYLATVIDLFSRKCVGWSFAKTLHRNIVVQALSMAVKARNPAPGLVFHSDKGSQYASAEFRQLAKNSKILLSMSGTGKCWDNAPAESFFALLKTELVHHEDFRTRSEAQLSVFQWIEGNYNRRRIHSSIGYVTPQKFEEDFFMQTV
jgi:putative transposase